MPMAAAIATPHPYGRPLSPTATTAAPSAAVRGARSDSVGATSASRHSGSAASSASADGTTAPATAPIRYASCHAPHSVSPPPRKKAVRCASVDGRANPRVDDGLHRLHEQQRRRPPEPRAGAAEPPAEAHAVEEEAHARERDHRGDEDHRRALPVDVGQHRLRRRAVDQRRREQAGSEREPRRREPGTEREAGRHDPDEHGEHRPCAVAELALRRDHGSSVPIGPPAGLEMGWRSRGDQRLRAGRAGDGAGTRTRPTRLLPRSSA